MANPLKNLAGQTVVYGLGTIVPRLLNYLLTPFLTYGFTAAQFGINSELYAYISFLNVIFTYGMETTFFNFQTRLDDKDRVFSTALSSITISTLVFSFILLGFTHTIADTLTTPNAVYLPSFISWSILIVATDALMALPFARLRAQQKAMQFSILKLLNVVVNFTLTIFFLRVCKSAYEANANDFFATIYDPQIGIGYAFLAGLIANVITLLFVMPSLKGIGWAFDSQLLREMLGYAWPLLILGLAGMVNETLDRIILKKLMVDKTEAQNALGIYGACYKIAILMTIFRQAFQFSAEPFFFSKSKEKDSKTTYAIVMKYFIIFCLFIFLGTMLNLDWIQYFVGQNFRSGLGVVPILLFANICLGVVYNLSIWFKLSGKTRFGAIISIVGAVITLVVNWVFIPRYSYMACAWATLAAYAGMMMLSYFLGQKYYPVKYNIRAILFYVALTVTIWGISHLLGGINSTAARLVLNNLLIVVFVWLVWKLEIANIKRLSSSVQHSDPNHQ